MMKNDIYVNISGREHKGKTSLTVLFHHFLTEKGIAHTLARTDKQLEEKLEHIDLCVERLTGEDAPSIILCEVNTGV